MGFWKVGESFFVGRLGLWGVDNVSFRGHPSLGEIGESFQKTPYKSDIKAYSSGGTVIVPAKKDVDMSVLICNGGDFFPNIPVQGEICFAMNLANVYDKGHTVTTATKMVGTGSMSLTQGLDAICFVHAVLNPIDTRLKAVGFNTGNAHIVAVSVVPIVSGEEGTEATAFNYGDICWVTTRSLKQDVCEDEVLTMTNWTPSTLRSKALRFLGNWVKWVEAPRFMSEYCFVILRGGWGKRQQIVWDGVTETLGVPDPEPEADPEPDDKDEDEDEDEDNNEIIVNHSRTRQSGKRRRKSKVKSRKQQAAQVSDAQLLLQQAHDGSSVHAPLPSILGLFESQAGSSKQAVADMALAQRLEAQQQLRATENRAATEQLETEKRAANAEAENR